MLGQALHRRLIHRAKAKNDRLDANKIARLLKGGNFPLAYISPRRMCATRDLLRGRCYLVHKRSELLTHLQILNAQYNLPDSLSQERGQTRVLESNRMVKVADK